MKQMIPEKLGPSFHRSFALRRSGLSQLLALAGNEMSSGQATTKKSIDYTTIWENTSLGTVDAQATSRYAVGLGLLSKDGLSAFGHTVIKKDPGISNRLTQWVFHYHMCAPHRNGPIFWGHLVTTLFDLNKDLTAEQVAQDIETLYLAQGNKSLKADTYRGAATAFLGTYSKWDGLGDLKILAEPVNGEYAVGDPISVPWRVAAYALADYWESNWNDRTGVNLERLREVGALLLVGSGEMNGFLRTMQEHGLVDVQRRHPPFQVTRLFPDADSVLAHLYDADEA